MTDLTNKRPERMTPGTYISKRRAAAGIASPMDVALAIADDVASVEEMRLRLVAIESDQLVAVPNGPRDMSSVELDVFLDRLLGAFSFDKAVFLALVAAVNDPARPVPPICRDCACTFFDPCKDEWLGTCAWSNAGSDEQPLCTQCETKAIDPGPGPIGGAGRREVHHAA